MEFEKLSEDYKRACMGETKSSLNEMINNFVDDDNLDGDYKDKIINMIVGLLTLKRY